MEPLKIRPIVRPLDIHEDTCVRACMIMEQKAADYASAEDPYRNFRQIEALDLGTVEQGLVVRMGDKLSRLATFVKTQNEYSVKDESFEDTIVDLINYSIILLAAYQSRDLQDKES
jgi:hypothetical protein